MTSSAPEVSDWGHAEIPALTGFPRRRPWLTRDLDLAAYLAKVGQPEREPSRDALAALHRAHRRTLPFENLDVLLDQHRGVSVAAVQEKFLGRPRGGYCFEHAVLFAAALERLGYAVQRHLGRVGDPLTSPRTHLSLIVDVEGDRILCDPGLGWTLIKPLHLVDGAHSDLEGWEFALASEPVLGEPTWRLSRRHGAEWEPMHWVDEAPVRPVDVELAHHWTSAWPGSHFRSTLRVSGLTSRGNVLGVSLDGVTLRRPTRRALHQPLSLDAHELGRHLSRVGIRPTEDELNELTDRLRALAPASRTGG